MGSPWSRCNATSRMLRTADHLQSQLAGPHALASQMTGCLVATQARLGQPDQARATLAALPPSKRPRASSATPPR
jgi:hypothetical protein